MNVYSETPLADGLESHDGMYKVISSDVQPDMPMPMPMPMSMPMSMPAYFSAPASASASNSASNSASGSGSASVARDTETMLDASVLEISGTSSTPGTGENGNNSMNLVNFESELREQDRWLPIANVARIMKKTLPANAKVSKDAKECMQECVSEFISFVTSESSDKCISEKRKTINGEDILFAMTNLGFENYSEVLKIYLAKYRQQQAQRQEKGEYFKRRPRKDDLSEDDRSESQLTDTSHNTNTPIDGNGPKTAPDSAGPSQLQMEQPDMAHMVQFASAGPGDLLADGVDGVPSGVPDGVPGDAELLNDGAESPEGDVKTESAVGDIMGNFTQDLSYSGPGVAPGDASSYYHYEDSFHQVMNEEYQ